MNYFDIFIFYCMNILNIEIKRKNKMIVKNVFVSKKILEVFYFIWIERFVCMYRLKGFRYELSLKF